MRRKLYYHAWEQCKLGEVAAFSKGNGYSKGDLTSDGTPIILYGRLYTKYETVIEDVDTFVEIRERSVVSKGGEVIVPSSGETAEDISRASVVSKAGVILGGDLNIVKPNNTLDPAFLAIAISNGNQQNELSKRAQGKSVVHISNSDLKDVALQLPTLTEQTSISNFFCTLDNALTFYKRKLDGLRELKKGYLQQMFPQNGERVPRVRFKGYTNEWETKKAGEIFISVSDKNHPHLPVLSASQEKGMVFRNEIGIDIKYDENALGTYKRILPHQFAIHLRSFQGGFAHSTIEGITSPAYTVLDFESQNEHVSEFWKEIFTSPMFIKRLETITYGIRDGRSISFSEFSTLTISCPSFEEQTAIGNFFRAIDEQIATQTQRMEQLKQLKAAYLQKMFV